MDPQSLWFNKKALVGKIFTRRHCSSIFACNNGGKWWEQHTNREHTKDLLSCMELVIDTACKKRLWKKSILDFSVSGFSSYVGGTRQVIHSLKQQIFLLLFRKTNCNRVSVNIRKSIWEVAMQRAASCWAVRLWYLAHSWPVHWVNTWDALGSRRMLIFPSSQKKPTCGLLKSHFSWEAKKRDILLIFKSKLSHR